MRPDKRAVVVAAAAVMIAVVLGYWAGAVPGVAAALAGLIPAAFLQAASARQDSAGARRARLAAAGTAFAPRAIEIRPGGEDATGGGGVAQYLRPEAEAVRFWERPELADLLKWMAAREQVAVALITGPGGAGKTRLARELGERATGLGWRSYWVPAGQEAAAVAAARDGDQPVLLVADYAETRAGLAGMLAAAAVEGGPVVRVLLLARSDGEWWQQLQRGCPEPVRDLRPAAPLTLGPVAAPAGQDEVFAEALAAFAALRGIECPDARLRPADAGAVVLVVHAAALLVVLDAEAAASRPGAAGSGGGAGGDVLDRLLWHEGRYWQGSLAGWGGVSLDPDVIDRAVTAGCLIGAADQGAAMRLLAVIADLSDGLPRGKVARWLHDLYPVPADGPEWIGQLQPDLLTERLVVTVLARHGELIPALFTGLDEARARRALTLLARAGLTQPAALDQARQALGADPARLLIPAVAVTTETNGALAAAITEAAAGLDTAALIPLADAIPHPTVALAGVYAAVTRQITHTLPPGADPADRARWLNTLGNALAQLGQPRDALPATKEAVAVYRELAAASPDRYRPVLARSPGQPRRPVLGAGPAGRRAASHPGGRSNPPGAGRGQPRLVPPRPRPLPGKAGRDPGQPGAGR